MTRCYTNPRLPLPLSYLNSFSAKYNFKHCVNYNMDTGLITLQHNTAMRSKHNDTTKGLHKPIFFGTAQPIATLQKSSLSSADFK